MPHLVIAPFPTTIPRRSQGGRPVPWLDRTSEMLRTVTSSKRTRYATAEIQDLFGVMERSAQKLMKLMPRFQTGPGFEVSREDLMAFLERVEVHRDAGMDVPGLLNQMLAAGSPILREQLPLPLVSPIRLTPRPRTLASLPDSVVVRRGMVELHGRTREDVAAAAAAFAAVIETDEFAEAFELRKPVARVAPEVAEMFEELKQMEAAHAQSA
jgi:hypothetical protein